VPDAASSRIEAAAVSTAAKSGEMDGSPLPEKQMSLTGMFRAVASTIRLQRPLFITVCAKLTLFANGKTSQYPQSKLQRFLSGYRFTHMKSPPDLRVHDEPLFPAAMVFNVH
jgi:hypothetical protein